MVHRALSYKTYMISRVAVPFKFSHNGHCYTISNAFCVYAILVSVKLNLTESRLMQFAQCTTCDCKVGWTGAVVSVTDYGPRGPWYETWSRHNLLWP